MCVRVCVCVCVCATLLTFVNVAYYMQFVKGIVLMVGDALYRSPLLVVVVVVVAVAAAAAAAAAAAVVVGVVVVVFTYSPILASSIHMLTRDLSTDTSTYPSTHSISTNPPTSTRT